ncbi:MAG: AAA family ATPase [Actinobacteria bacterium]|nr:AAA family ATPase [Actinomycetota bacterium]
MGTIRCPVLVGREDEFARADAALADARSGHGSVVAFVGEGGIGKTRIAKDLMTAARRRGLRVVAGRSTLESNGVPLRPWAEALMAGTRDVEWPAGNSKLAPYRAALGMLVPRWRGEAWSTPAEAAVVVGEAILRALEHLAGSDGLLVVLDDLHFADEQTMQSLGFVVDHIAEVPVLLCLGLRDEGNGVRIIAAVNRAGFAESRLARLTPPQVMEMVDRCSTGGNKLVDIESIAEDSEGLPLLVEDLLSVDAPGQRPRRFADVVRAHLQALPIEHRQVVQAAAVFGERIDWQLIADALSLDGGMASESLARAIGEGLFVPEGEHVRFRHALTRSVIAADLVPIKRAELALALANAVRRTPVGFEGDLLTADLLVEAGQAAVASDVLAAAGERAEAAGELADSAVARGRAFRLARDHNLPGSLQLGTSLVRVDLQIGRIADAVVLGNELLTRSDGTNREITLELHLLLAKACLDLAEWVDAEAHLITARGLADTEIVLAQLVLLEAECAFGADRPGQRAAVEHQAEKAIAMARRTDDDRLLCDAYLFAGRVARLRDLNDAAAALEQALEIAEKAKLSVHRLRVLDELGTVEMLRDARTDRLERAYNEALRVGAFGSAASAGLNLASAYAMTGRHSQCAQLASDVEASAVRLGLRNLEAASQLTLGIAAAFSGDRDKAEVHCARAEQLAPTDGDLRVGVWAIAHGIGALIDGDRMRARRAFATARSHSPERHARILDASLGPSMLLDAVAGVVSPTVLRAALAAEVRGARWSQLWLGTALAASLATVGEPAEAADELVTALGSADRYPLFGAIARRVIADTAVATGFTDPVDLLRDAEAAFTALGLPRSAEATRAMLRSLGHAAPRQRHSAPAIAEDLRRAGVTAREADVLAYLGERRTNREIAAQLYLSPKTVEKHVAALASKLGAANRVELADIARRRQPD